jgi:hypothetical protein
MYGFNINAQLQVTVTISCRLCTLHDVMEITNGQPLQNTSQNSVFWGGAECHC